MPACVRKTGQKFNNRDGFRFVHSVGNWLLTAEVTFPLCSNEFRTLHHAQLMLVHSCDETCCPEPLFARSHSSFPIPARCKTPPISSPAWRIKRQEKTVGVDRTQRTPPTETVRRTNSGRASALCNADCQGLTVWSGATATWCGKD